MKKKLTERMMMMMGSWMKILSRFDHSIAGLAILVTSSSKGHIGVKAEFQ